MKRVLSVFLVVLIVIAFGCTKDRGDHANDNIDLMTLTYPIVDTGVTESYSDVGIIAKPEEGSPFYGQDSNYTGNKPNYTDNGDGTVTDNVTGLMWMKDMEGKMTWDEAMTIPLTKIEKVLLNQFMNCLFKIMLLLFFMGMTIFMPMSKGTEYIIF